MSECTKQILTITSTF